MKASDFYFQLSNNDGDYFFLITPRTYYDSQGCLSDESGIADGILPEGFSELAESTYEYNKEPQLGRQILIDIGMKEINFGLQPGEPSKDGSEEDEYYDDEDPEDNEIDNLLYRDTDQLQINAFDYKNISTDKLIRHMNIMVSTEAFEEAAKIKKELDSRA
ncbi:MAG TPA: hypothetical protein VIH28_06895 [Ignavibacteriaceae bacterium]